MVPGPGKVELIYTPSDGSPATNLEVYTFEGKTASGGVALSMYNTEEVWFMNDNLFNILIECCVCLYVSP